MEQSNSGVFDLLGSAGSTASSEYVFSLSGDLCQMSSQDRFLRGRGFNVGRSDVYPMLKEEDVEKALTEIWKSKVEGWWHYLPKYLEFQICTKEEFKNAF